MEANNHFNFTGLPSSPAASGLKPAPSSGDVYTNGSPVNFPQQGKSLNGDVNVNGISTVSHASTSGNRTSANSHLHHPYDYLWNYSQYPSGSGNNLKDSPLFSQYPLNGTVGGNRQGSPGHSTNLRGSGGQEFWTNGAPGAMGLNFDSAELYDSFPDDQNFELLQNGPSSFYTSAQPSPMLGSSSQDFSPQQNGPGNEETVKETSSAISENGNRLLGSMELESTQPELKMCDYSGSSPVGEPLSQEASVLEPDAGGSCSLEEASQIPPPLEDSLEPFESLDRDPGTGDLYEMDTSELVSGKSPLEDPPDISALECPGSPSLNPSDSFSLLADDSQPDTSLFGSANLPPVLGESVLQDSSLELSGVNEVGQEGTELLGSQAPLEPAGLDAPIEEEAESSCSKNTTSVTDGKNKDVSALSVSSKSDPPRRRIATVEEVRYPLKHGWRREVRIKKGSSRWQGETWYYGPCGKRMKQFPEVIKYLSRNIVQNVRREHFSFSPRMPVGDFFEERETPEGLKWVKLASEEIPSRILAITGKRGRPRNTEKAKAKEMPKVKRGRGRPPKVKVPDLQSKTDVRVLKKLEAQEVASDEDKVKISKTKKKMRQKVQSKQKQETKASKPKDVKPKEVKRKPKFQVKKEKSKPEKNKPEKLKEKVKPKEKMKPKEKKVALSTKIPRKIDKNLLAQKRQEERLRQQMILEEMKKPAEDMCLGDHQPLPEFSRIPGLVLPSHAFADCLAIVEFLHNYGKVLGFDVAREVPSLSTLQEGLFNVGDSLGEVLDLLVKLVKAALYDPGLPSYCQSLKILGEKLSEISLNRDTVSEILRCFLIAYGADEDLCNQLRTKPFQALPPDKKAALLAFLVNELNSSALIINEIDKTLENMSNHRRNKWIIEGKLRRLKIAIAKKTGRPESEITGLEEGRWRRSSRNTDEREDIDVEEEERSRACKAQKDYENDIPVSSVPVLERQIEKLSKRQMFFRKKLLHASQLLRASSLGQDRYRRRYWVLPHLGGIFVEGCEASTAAPSEVSKNELEKEEARKEEKHEVSPVKKETTDTPSVVDYMNCTPVRSWGQPWQDSAGLLPSESFDSKSPEPMSMSANGFLEDSVSLGQSQHDLTQSAFLSWLSQTQQASSLLNSSVLTPDSSPGKDDSVPPDELPDSGAEDESVTETQVAWFNLMPRAPYNDSLFATSTEQPSVKPASQHCRRPTKDQSKVSSQQLNGLSTPSPALPPLASTPLHFSSRIHNTCSRMKDIPSKSQEPPGLPRRRGRPPTKLFKQIEQKYLTQQTAQPIPPEMQSGWWWLQDPEELETVVQVLHPRGIREKALHKHLTKHKDYLREMCARAANDPIFQTHPESASHPVSEEALAQWSMAERAFETDLSVLQWVEELEQRVLMADLQIRGWTSPDPDSVRNDLQYCERDLELLEDITIKNRREGSALHRETTNPLDLAVLRLADLEQNLERRYLREPLWPPHEVVVEKALLSNPSTLELGTTEISYEITPRMRLWRQTLEKCHSAAQVSLCIYQLEHSIAWEKSVVRATCLVCRKGDDDENLLLCDSCDRGCHLYCHRPKMTEVPAGDWFCSLCIAQMQGEYQDGYSSPRRSKKRKGGSTAALCGQEELSPRSRAATSQQHSSLASVPSRYSGEGLSPSKRRRVSTRGQSADLTFCEIILMDMESHEAAWPFLEPVNPRLVPGYRKIIKNPMDFATMRARLLRGGYTSCEEFAADAALVFDNCRAFNEDESEVGKAGLIMRQFFESRWEEFYQGKQETTP
nr:bromodomain adjacent to zinc finger domain protein 2A isoform X2 [Pogona vitticeps]XP_020640371.1 bromodomain adjacent to zinc finger domain protein 2A isoform X2 [Pogona vitticeps]XP_020640380.1 bromodomain adjacent to zinc finger domain protein 2A isoform X2 [Pogona vitticeps]XP_020640391.1 bromodomain adjacent to zinc finger domain protein 2A isoform X2 [Pogona vitticeps]XP_020640399.1 bromodomain adjacent to zinc finger domain protein 2A isoform X2 [Pogona vitticeps]XP_020640404.1 bromo